MVRSEPRRFDWALNGKLRNDIDALMIGVSNFARLQNLRYVQTGIEGIAGMTKVNAAATNYLRIDNGFHFKKGQPEEQHLFVQTTTGANSRIVKAGKTAVLPLQDTFTAWKTLTNNNRVMFADAPDAAMVLMDGTQNWIWGGDEFRISRFINFDDSGSTFWYDYTDKITNTLQDAQNVCTLHGTAPITFYIAATRPLKGFKSYVKVANTSAGVMTAEEWTGTAWVNCPLTDNTSVGGKTLAQTGTVVFTTSTDGTSKIKIIKSICAYWYKITLSGMSAGTQLYYCTGNADLQSIKDIWDGSPSLCMQFEGYNNFATKFSDLSYNISKEYPYESSTTYTYANIAIGAGGAFFAGFISPQMALKIDLPDSSSVNTQSVNIEIAYFNGSSFTTVGTVVDGTSVDGKTLSASGVVSWNPVDPSLEYVCDILPGNGAFNKDLSIQSLYWYKITTSGSTSVTVKCNGISGIPAPVIINPHRFAITWQNRLWLFDNMVKDRNQGWCSGYNTNCVFQGSDSGKIFFGNSEPIICAETMFSRYSGGLYDSLVILKKNAIYILDGTSVEDYKIYTITTNTGCISPLTLRKCDIGYEIAPGISKHILLFLSSRGIELFDGNSPPVIVSKDVGDYFDPNSANYINLSMVDQFYAFIDERNMEYHLLLATGSSTTLNVELVYDITQKKSYDIDRGTGKALNCGFNVTDPYGNKFTFGGTTDGYIERLENGTTFDGNPIVYIFKTGDVPLADTLMDWTELHRIKLTAKSMATSAAQVTMKHYIDGELVGVVLERFGQINALARYYKHRGSTSRQGTAHAIECSVTTTDELCGFKPYVISGSYSILREDY